MSDDKRVHIDFETFSEAKINKVGAYRYAADASTEMLCMAYCQPEWSAPKLTTDADEAKALIESWIAEGRNMHAWNSFFEMSISHEVLGIDCLNPEYWTDTAAAAAALALPRSLGDCGAALGLSKDKAKDKRGKYLIQRLCQPYRGKRVHDDELLKELYAYCLQDVVAEMEISRLLRPLSAFERKVWECDQRLNARGIRIDRAAVNDALVMIDRATQELNDEVSRITAGKLDGVSSAKQVKEYAAEAYGYTLKNYQSGYIEKCLKDETIPAGLKRLLEIRQQTGKTSLAKYTALEKIINDDDRARGLLLYHGASTGRWSGRLFQPQNLPRPSFDDTDLCIDLFSDLNLKQIDFFYGAPLEALSSCIRGMIVASEGHRLIVSDYSAIEARVLSWLAYQQDVLKVFNTHGLLYEHTASQIYGTPIEQVTKSQRTIGKVAALALGYQGADGAFNSMAAIYGVEVSSKLAEQVIKDWRKSNNNIVNFWYELDEAAVKAVRTGQTTQVNIGIPSQPTNPIMFRVHGDFLFCKLPSGRLLAYFSPAIDTGRFGNAQVSYMGVNSYTRKWERQHIYGGKWAENITQAVARDVMASAMLKLEAKGYKIILSVHDELIAEAPIGVGSLADLEATMCDLPAWAKGLPINAAGFEAKRYRKD